MSKAVVPLIQAIGRPIRCPDPGCGAIGMAEAQRGAAAPPGMLPPPPGVAPGQAVVVPQVRWAIVRCPRTGAKLFPAHTPVELHIDA